MGADAQGDAILRGSLRFARVLTETTSISNDTLVETGENNTYFENDTALSVRIYKALAFKFGFQVRHNTDVPPGVDKTDTVTTMNLAYKF